MGVRLQGRPVGAATSILGLHCFPYRGDDKGKQTGLEATCITSGWKNITTYIFYFRVYRKASPSLYKLYTPSAQNKLVCNSGVFIEVLFLAFFVSCSIHHSMISTVCNAIQVCDCNSYTSTPREMYDALSCSLSTPVDLILLISV